MDSTADSWNRRRDKERVEKVLGLQEEGDNNIVFLSPLGMILARGYSRIVYGDHGPYIELEERHLEDGAWYKARDKHPESYYDELWPVDGSGVMLYVQKKTVADLPNPPAGKWSTRNNRPEGYADYQVGKCYIDPYKVIIKEG